MSPKTIGLIAHTGKRGVAELINAVGEEFVRFSMSILLERETAKIAGKKSDYSISELAAKSELLVVLGGDGTILHVAGQLGEVMKPIFGINVGSLGFLTCVSSADYRKAVESIAKGSIAFSERTLLDVRVAGSKDVMVGLNDVVFTRGEVSRLIRLRTKVNGEALTEFNADGLIIATPTGSTAYSLSAGGPIVAPTTQAMVLTPLAPNGVFDRSLVVGPAETVRIDVLQGSSPVVLERDGRRHGEIPPGGAVEVSKSAEPGLLVRLGGTNFYGRARRKLRLADPPVFTEPDGLSP
jgi:NAD+ kinase